MPFQAVPGVCEATLILVRGTDPELQDWIAVEKHAWYNGAAGWDAGRQTDLKDAIDDWWNDEVSPLVCDNYRLYSITTRDLGTEFGLSQTTVVNRVGTNGLLQPEPVLSMVVTKTCAAGGEPRRGRTYVGGLDEDQHSGHQWDASVTANMTLAYNSLLGAYTDDSAVVVVISRFSGRHQEEKPDGTRVWVPTPRTPATSRQVIDVHAHQAVATQVRRK